MRLIIINCTDVMLFLVEDLLLAACRTIRQMLLSFSLTEATIDHFIVLLCQLIDELSLLILSLDELELCLLYYLAQSHDQPRGVVELVSEGFVERFVDDRCWLVKGFGSNDESTQLLHLRRVSNLHHHLVHLMLVLDVEDVFIFLPQSLAEVDEIAHLLHHVLPLL